MSVSINIPAGTKTDAIVPSTTSKTAILTGVKGIGYPLLGLIAYNNSGGAATLQLHFLDDSKNPGTGVETCFYPATSIASGAREVIDLSNITLDADDQLRATVSVAGSLDLTLSYATRGSGY